MSKVIGILLLFRWFHLLLVSAKHKKQKQKTKMFENIYLSRL